MINDQDIDGLAHRYVLASRRLEIGPGDCPLVGEWDTLDSHPIPSVPLTYVAKWGLERLPIEDCSYDLVFCMAEGSQVLTRLGFKPIQDVVAGDEVWTHARRWRRVTGNREFSGCHKMVKVVTGSNSMGVLVTSNHPVMAKHFRSRKSGQFTRAMYENSVGDAKFFNASELTRLHVSVCPVPDYCSHSRTIDLRLVMKENRDVCDYKAAMAIRSGGRRIGDVTIARKLSRTTTIVRGWIYHGKKPVGYYHGSDSIVCHKKGESRSIPAVVEINSDLMRLLGYFLADGSLYASNRERHVGFHFNTSEWEYINDVSDIILRTFGIEPTDIRQGDDSEGVTLRYASAPLYDIIAGIFCGEKCDKKSVPAWALWIEPLLQMDLIEGFYRGDGTPISERGRSLSTVSESLAEGLRLCLLRNGILAGLCKVVHEPKPDAKIRSRGYRYVVNYTVDRKKQIGGCVAGGHVVSRVLSVVESDQSLSVYGLQVDGDETFYASGIMHHNSSHAIEHVPWYHAKDALREVFRIVRPGGAFEVWTVDFAVVVEYYLAHRVVGDWDCGGRISNYMQSVSGRVFAYEKNGSPWMWHKALFDRPYLRSLLLECGFDRVEDLRQTRGHDHGVINMGMVAFKNSLAG